MIDIQADLSNYSLNQTWILLFAMLSLCYASCAIIFSGIYQRIASIILTLATITGLIISIVNAANYSDEGGLDRAVSEKIAEAGKVDHVKMEKEGEMLYANLMRAEQSNYYSMNAEVQVGEESRYITLALEPVDGQEYKFELFIVNSSDENVPFTAENILNSEDVEPEQAIKN